MAEIHQLGISSAFLLSALFFLSNPAHLPSLYFPVLFSFITPSFQLHHLVTRSLSPTYSSSLSFSKIAHLALSPAGPHLLSCHPPLLQLSFLILLSIPSSSPLILFSSLATKSPLLLNHHVAPSSSHPANPALFLSA